MSAFDRVIGYDSIKTELLQIVDIIHNPDIYKALGAKIPRGVLLDGDPGLGKTLLAQSFIEESGLKAFTLRRSKGGDGFTGEISETFRNAVENAPCIVFLDDMDKFANEDDRHKDAEEYVAIQAGIDDAKDSEVFVIATVNDGDKLPASLTRPGRFDRIIHISTPNDEDAAKIIDYYLSDKKLSPGVNIEDISKMISYSSCATLETILNEASIYAAYERKPEIEMNDIVKAVLRMTYHIPDNINKLSSEDIESRAVHEAGHLVVSEVLCPGSVGMASVNSKKGGSSGGFIHQCLEMERRPHMVMVSLGGKCATEMVWADTFASGCQSDLDKAVNLIRSGMMDNGTCGLGLLDVRSRFSPESSENLNSRMEAVVYAELERHMLRTKELLLRNEEFLWATVEALAEKETLLYSDIKAIREGVHIINVDI